MTTADRRVRDLARDQLDRRLTTIRDLGSLLDPPRRGWIHAIRRALGMPQAHLAQRLGVSRQAVGQLEQRELEGSVTLKALDEAARALGGRLVYAIVPEHSVDETLDRRAWEIAARMTGSVRHSMKLEDQEPTSDLEERTHELAEELRSRPSGLWSDPDER